jgi:hypothetical protein
MRTLLRVVPRLDDVALDRLLADIAYLSRRYA